MYLVPLKAALVDACKQTFTSDYPVQEMRDLWVSIEYPVAPQNFPGLWIDYEDTGPVQIAGIGHTEQTVGSGFLTVATRWRFSGIASFTVVAFTSLERDIMYDELIRTFAFASRDDQQISVFRQTVETNDLIAMNMNFDRVDPRGSAQAPGTPWGTDEVIYERTINIELIGEFVSDGATSALVSLSHLVFDESIIENGIIPDEVAGYPGTTQGNYLDPTAWQ